MDRPRRKWIDEPKAQERVQGWCQNAEGLRLTANSARFALLASM